MKLPIYQVDAFTNQPFSGNPAAVTLYTEERPEQWMQSLAAEMNLSETAFVMPIAGSNYRLRWFTPKTEVALCGHATLASAHILWSEGYLTPDDTASFHTLSGILTAQYKSNWIEMNFPAQPVGNAIDLPELETILGVKAVFIGKNQSDYLVEVKDEESVRSAQPNIERMKTLPARGVILTARAQTRDFDFVSRFFAPAVGVDEDPVTGSAHCCLGPYWQAKLDKSELFAYQASARGGMLRICVQPDRVLISGQAVTIFRGELNS